jgi:hypothetical protein
LVGIAEAHDRISMNPPADGRAFALSEDGMAFRFFPPGTTLRAVRREYPQAKALPKTWHPIELVKRMRRESPGPIDDDAVAAPRVEEWRRQVDDTLVSWLRRGLATLPSVTVVGTVGDGLDRRPDVRHQGAPLLLQLHRVLTGKRVPFGLCPVCDRVFYRVKRQQYCGPACAERGTSKERKAHRREYMRAYMEKRRTLARKDSTRERER